MTSDDAATMSVTWNDGETSATLSFTPSKGIGVVNTQSGATLAWQDADGDHVSDDLIANPPVARKH